MPRATLAGDLTISRIITGLWQIADSERDGGQMDLDGAGSVMAAHVDEGLTSFDMADHYGSAELIAGRFEEGSPGAAEFLTKWVPSPGRHVPGDARQAVERALKRTSRETVDLLQYHTWTYDDPSWLDHVFELDELRREGLIAHLGVTNMDTAHLRMLLESGVKVASNQVCYSLIDRRAQGAMTALCLQYGVKLLAYGTLAGGLLTARGLEMRGRPASEMPSWSLMKYSRFVDAVGGWERFRGALDTLADVARRIGSSMAHVAIRYVMDSPAVAGVIVGSRLDAVAAAGRNLPVFDVRLDDDSRNQLEEAFGALDPAPGDCGDEYRRR